MKANQKILYDHFVNLTKTGKDSITRDKAKRHAKQILESWPEFEVKEKVKEIKSNSKVIKEKR